MRGTSPHDCRGATATHNRISVPIRGQSIESSRALCDFVPGLFEFFCIPSSQGFPLSRPAAFSQELIQAREGLHFERAPIAGDAAAKGSQRKMLHQPRKHQLASVHRWPPRSYASQGGRIGIRRSNRNQEKFAAYGFLINNLRKAKGKTLGPY